MHKREYSIERITISMHLGQYNTRTSSISFVRAFLSAREVNSAIKKVHILLPIPHSLTLYYTSMFTEHRLHSVAVVVYIGCIKSRREKSGSQLKKDCKSHVYLNFAPCVIFSPIFGL